MSRAANSNAEPPAPTMPELPERVRCTFHSCAGLVRRGTLLLSFAEPFGNEDTETQPRPEEKR
jgi:hypothetical protein